MQLSQESLRSRTPFIHLYSIAESSVHETLWSNETWSRKLLSPTTPPPREYIIWERAPAQARCGSHLVTGQRHISCYLLLLPTLFRIARPTLLRSLFSAQPRSSAQTRGMYRNRYYSVLLRSLLLSVSVQTLSASANPLTSSEDSSAASPLPRALPHGFRPPLVFKSIPGIDYETWTAPTTNADSSWPATIALQEIGDGQVQAVSRTKSKLRKGRKHRKASAIKTKTTAANNTQDARKFQEAKITRSTKSRPTRANKQKAADVVPTFTTTIPDLSLASLTTSEVQTINGPQPSDTSGVSSSLL